MLVSLPLSNWPPSVYTSHHPGSASLLQIDSGVEKEDDSEEEVEGHAGNAAPELSAVSEMRLIPEDASVLDHLFSVMSECAELNPDPEAGGEDGEGDFFYDEDEVRASDSRGAALDHFDSLLQAPDHVDEVRGPDSFTFSLALNESLRELVQAEAAGSNLFRCSVPVHLVFGRL
jgi:nucleotide-sensitive chloride channel 1A